VFVTLSLFIHYKKSQPQGGRLKPLEYDLSALQVKISFIFCIFSFAENTEVYCKAVEFSA